MDVPTFKSVSFRLTAAVTVLYVSLVIFINFVESPDDICPRRNSKPSRRKTKRTVLNLLTTLLALASPALRVAVSGAREDVAAGVHNLRKSPFEADDQQQHRKLTACALASGALALGADSAAPLLASTQCCTDLVAASDAMLFAGAPYDGFVTDAACAADACGAAYTYAIGAGESIGFLGAGTVTSWAAACAVFMQPCPSNCAAGSGCEYGSTPSCVVCPGEQNDRALSRDKVKKITNPLTHSRYLEQRKRQKHVHELRKW